ncbi:FAD assembly factor SdhE [Cucumibacter marinus]|uniref:FAD assembly factor SdhE n=1 Tax=Cucumibacter marinus TaxID=1121252 RepID=UPI00040E5F5E|nr:succinate dehydrogenase assembly factor 2 [Cucumibacter marinus]
MTASNADESELVRRRKRAHFRAWHRGTKEMDLLMGRFADARIEAFDEPALTRFEALLEIADTELQVWLTGQAAVPPDVDKTLIAEISAFHADGDPQS